MLPSENIRCLECGLRSRHGGAEISCSADCWSCLAKRLVSAELRDKRERLTIVSSLASLQRSADKGSDTRSKVPANVSYSGMPRSIHSTSRDVI